MTDSNKQEMIFVAKLKSKSLTTKIKNYFKDESIEIVKYQEQLGIITLKSHNDLRNLNLKYLEDIALDSPIKKA